VGSFLKGIQGPLGNELQKLIFLVNVCMCMCVWGGLYPLHKERAVFTTSDTVVLILGFTLESPDELLKLPTSGLTLTKRSSILGEWLVLHVFEELPG